jgi:hypothetical protein
MRRQEFPGDGPKKEESCQATIRRVDCEVFWAQQATGHKEGDATLLSELAS